MEASNSTTSTVETEGKTQEEGTSSEQTLRLCLKKEKKKLKWTEETIDNEGLGKKKSKCCCQYKKPRKDLEESSSDSEDEDCGNCSGHT